MDLKEIAERINILKVFEKRQIKDNYIELVFFNKEINEWDKLLSGILGPAVKPAGVSPDKEAQKPARDYGGIYANQTLFRKDFNDTAVIAMFWPWQDGVHTTLKVILVNR